MKPIRFTDHGRKRAKVMQALPDAIQLAVNSPEVTYNNNEKHGDGVLYQRGRLCVAAYEDHDAYVVISVLPRGQVFKRDSKGRVL